MLRIFSATVLKGQDLALYPARAQKLHLVLEEQLEGKLEHWQKVCHNITHSKFLMGESKGSDFKATLDWLLEGHNATKVLEGAYGVGDRVARDEQLPVKAENGIQDIEALDEPLAMKELRLWFLQRFGVFDYNAWFQDVAFQGFEDQTFAIAVQGTFFQEQISCRFAHEIREYLENKYRQRICLDIRLKSSHRAASTMSTD